MQLCRVRSELEEMAINDALPPEADHNYGAVTYFQFQL